MRPADERYLFRLEAELDEALDRAGAARAKGYDPTTDVEIPVAQDMADRVEKVLDIPGVAERVRELEGEMSREEAALELVTDFVEGTVGDFDTRASKIEGAVRTAVALLTEGVVAAPIEGIDRVELLENDDGTEFINVYYAGPIRSAGGTAQALSVLVADYARALLGIDEYRARDIEIERYAEEVSLYDDDTGLQYTPSDAETKHIARHMPIMLDGEPTADEEVSGFRDLERVDTNTPRGGMCLVLAEGIALKAPKIQRYTRNLEEVDWPWLQDLIDGTVKDVEQSEDGGDEDTDRSTERRTDRGPPRVNPSEKYLHDLIAGRPVFAHPSEPGGFRLRYGRARNHGFATAGIHPATMHIVDDFLAAGTQIKTERPGKAAGVVPVDSIEGPTVRLANGDVKRIDDPEEALKIRNGIEEIIDLGEYLVNFGEFIENNHPLAPASYVGEWWEQDLEATEANVQALRDDPHVDLEEPTVGEAIEWATEYDAPLHPKYTYLWHDISVAEFETLAKIVTHGDIERPTDRHTPVGDGGQSQQINGHPQNGPTHGKDRLVIEESEEIRRTLETLLVEHSQASDRIVIPEFRPLLRSLGVDDNLQCQWEDLSERARTYDRGDNAIKAVNEVAPFTVRERAPTRIGNRMGRPEKSEERELSPAVHALYPIGEAGGNQRDIGEAARTRTDQGRGILRIQVGERVCLNCGTHTHENRCPECSAHTEPHYECDACGVEAEPDESGRIECPRCGKTVSSAVEKTVDVGGAYRDALDAVGEREAAFDILKGVKGLSSAHKTPEPLEKGVLRAKHGVSAFKDGTVRYDMTDLPVTAVRPSELDVSVARFKQLGYRSDINGDPLEHEDQLIELKMQDVVLSDGAADHMMRTAAFVDELLTDLYGLEPFYEVDDREDLIGELVFGMAPHTSAAVVGRVVGFTSASVGYAHPYFHAAKRRNCDGDEDCVMLLMDGLINFSKQYLPDQRGGQMDAPLVMSSRIDPSEIDDEAHNMDVVDRYPRELYTASRKMAEPETIDIELAGDSLGTEEAYHGFAHTHDTKNIAAGPGLSAYKTLGSMMDKTDAQLQLARILRAVDETDVAERVIEYHFLPDLIGNLRAFARQETRCLDCGEKYRRMPLSGDCRECGGDITLTVHQGSVNKYMEPAKRVAEEFGCREYTKQRLEILDRSLESIFENDHNKLSTLGDYM